jgi:hypothetical protein
MHRASECFAMQLVRHELFSAGDERALEYVVCTIDDDRSMARQFVWPDGRSASLRAEVGIKWRPGALEDEAALCERRPGERLQGWFSGTVDLAYVRHDGVLGAPRLPVRCESPAAGQWSVP